MKEFLQLPEVRAIFKKAKELITTANATALENALVPPELRSMHSVEFEFADHWDQLSALYLDFFKLGQQYYAKTPGTDHNKIARIHREWEKMTSIARSHAFRRVKRKKTAKAL